MKSFVFLENHSVFSLCEGTITIDKLLQYAKKKAFFFISLCDTNGFFGIINFILAVRTYKLRPVIGCRLKTKKISVLFIARNMRGYAKICHFITRTNLSPEYDLKNEILLDNCDFYAITSEHDLLVRQRPHVFAEINVLAENYFETYDYAKKLKIQPVLIYPVYFQDSHDFKIHKILRAVYHNKKLFSLKKTDIQNKKAHFLPINKILQKYAFMPDAIANTISIAANAQFEFPLGQYVFPNFNLYSFKKLKRICYNNLKIRYKNITTEVNARLKKELDLINRKGFAGYFLIVHDIVKQTAYTCGRGSAAASIVSYLLFITHVDPIAHNLFFERFLNESRPDPPDIDIDFCWDTRDQILDYTLKNFSREHTAMVANHITFSDRSSIREVAKVYGIPEQEINRVTKKIGHYYSRDLDATLNYSFQKISSPEWIEIVKIAAKLIGIPRFLSVHCGGLIVTPKPIRYYTPIQMATKGVPIIQLEKEQAEDFGLVKIDLLGNRSLAVVRDTLELVKQHYDSEIKYENFNPIRDPDTIDMFKKGNSIGVFYVESPAMRQLQKKTGYGDYEHLVIHSSMIRPAANAWIHEYIARLHGKKYTPFLPGMDKILKETYGIMCYQEDITKIAMKIAHFPIAEAEELRKVISKKNKIQRKLQLKKKFFQNLIKDGIAEKIIIQVWDMIESFSGYSFCKPHSASFALLSFKAGFLKAHYPAEFLGAVLNNQGGFYNHIAYISEARRLGLTIILPDVNISKFEYYGHKTHICIGLKQIKNLCRKLAKNIVTERERNGKYQTMIQFMQRTHCSLTDIKILIKANVFRSLETYNQPQLLSLACQYFGYYEDKQDTQSLFQHTYNFLYTKMPLLKDITYEQKLKNEINSFDAIISIHPMKYFRSFLKLKNIILANQLPKYTGKNIWIAGILITAKPVLTKTNELMKFISFEDETDIFETVLFPDMYKKFSSILSYQYPYLIKARVEEEYKTISLTILELQIIKC